MALFKIGAAFLKSYMPNVNIGEEEYVFFKPMVN